MGGGRRAGGRAGGRKRERRPGAAPWHDCGAAGGRGPRGAARHCRAGNRVRASRCAEHPGAHNATKCGCPSSFLSSPSLSSLHTDAHAASIRWWESPGVCAPGTAASVPLRVAGPWHGHDACEPLAQAGPSGMAGALPAEAPAEAPSARAAADAAPAAAWRGREERGAAPAVVQRRSWPADELVLPSGGLEALECAPSCLDAPAPPAAAPRPIARSSCSPGRRTAAGGGFAAQTGARAAAYGYVGVSCAAAPAQCTNGKLLRLVCLDCMAAPARTSGHPAADARLAPPHAGWPCSLSHESNAVLHACGLAPVAGAQARRGQARGGRARSAGAKGAARSAAPRGCLRLACHLSAWRCKPTSSSYQELRTARAARQPACRRRPQHGMRLDLLLRTGTARPGLRGIHRAPKPQAPPHAASSTPRRTPPVHTPVSRSCAPRIIASSTLPSHPTAPRARGRGARVRRQSGR